MVFGDETFDVVSYVILERSGGILHKNVIFFHP
jgi:hypothetical protein